METTTTDTIHQTHPEEHSCAEDEQHLCFLHSTLTPPRRVRSARSASVSSEHSIQHLFDNNCMWAEEYTRTNPTFFERLSTAQAPEYLWIGCADSRVPANEIVGLVPGELFVHRNVANVVGHTDFNCLSVLQYAVDVLKVKHVIVCGHYGCGGVLATMKGMRVGLVDNWLRHVDDVQQKHFKQLQGYRDETIRGNHLCELNVIEQVLNVCKTTVLRDAWSRGQDVTVHGTIYGMKDGLLRDLKITASSLDEAQYKYQRAVSSLPPPEAYDGDGSV